MAYGLALCFSQGFLGGAGLLPNNPGIVRRYCRTETDASSLALPPPCAPKLQGCTIAPNPTPNQGAEAQPSKSMHLVPMLQGESCRQVCVFGPVAHALPESEQRYRLLAQRVGWLSLPQRIGLEGWGCTLPSRNMWVFDLCKHKRIWKDRQSWLILIIS